MCIIVDANMLGEFVNHNDDMKPIYTWLDGDGGKMVFAIVGGDQERKSYKIFVESDLGRAYYEAGKINLLDPREVEVEIARIRQEHATLKSNDIHIIALARLGKAEVLVSADRALHADFKTIIGGSIYKDRTHRHLLTSNLCSKK